MSFHVNAEDLRVDDGSILAGKLPNEAGDLIDAWIDLNTIIGNEDGHFQWGGENFSHSAGNIEFNLEGDEEDQSPILRADLGKLDETEAADDLNLAERIANIDGQFVFN